MGVTRKLVDWLWRDETDVSELQPLRAFCSSPGDLQCELWMMTLTGKTPNLSTGALWSPQYCPAVLPAESISSSQPPVLSGFLPSETSLGQVSEGNENLVDPSPWDFKRSFTCRKIFHGTPGFTCHRKERVLRIFLSPLKIHRLGQARIRNL
jgi:hypothetical protein